MRKVTFIGLVLSLLVATGPAIWYWVIDLLYYDHTEGLVTVSYTHLTLPTIYSV